MTFAPDDFAGRPCIAGLNQMGYAVAGSAIVSVAPIPLAIAHGHVTGFPVYAPLCVPGLFVIEYARVAKWKN